MRFLVAMLVALASAIFVAQAPAAVTQPPQPKFGPGDVDRRRAIESRVRRPVSLEQHLSAAHPGGLILDAMPSERAPG